MVFGYPDVSILIFPTASAIRGYPVFGLQTPRSARRSFAPPSQKSQRNHCSYVRTEALSGKVFEPAQERWSLGGSFF